MRPQISIQPNLLNMACRHQNNTRDKAIIIQEQPSEKHKKYALQQNWILSINT